MSLQDDIFDIRHALRRKPAERAAFDRLCEVLNEIEQENDNSNRLLADLAAGLRALKVLEGRTE